MKSNGKIALVAYVPQCIEGTVSSSKARRRRNHPLRVWERRGWRLSAIGATLPANDPIDVRVMVRALDLFKASSFKVFE
jgi:hypothetical protein